MKRFAVTIIVIIILAAILAYIESGFLLTHHGLTTSAATTVTVATTISGVPVTTTINRGTLYDCYSYTLSVNKTNSTTQAHCLLTTNSIGIWAAAGDAGTAHLLVVGANNGTYVNQTISYNCTTFLTELTGPKQVYNITFTTGAGGGSCGQSMLIFNSTTSPPQQAYNFVYNGNFSNGQYTGWNASGAGFGTKPFNITYANNAIVKCYLSSPWNSSPGQYVASTYRCGTQTAPGNLTSSEFIANKPFLNFKIVSNQHGNIYVEILRNGSPAIVAAYNTFNLSLPNSTIKGKNVTTSIFRNATIPLTTVAGKIVRIRLVSSSVGTQYFMLAGGFRLSDTPNQQRGILINLTMYNST